MDAADFSQPWPVTAVKATASGIAGFVGGGVLGQHATLGLGPFVVPVTCACITGGAMVVASVVSPIAKQWWIERRAGEAKALRRALMLAEARAFKATNDLDAYKLRDAGLGALLGPPAEPRTETPR